MPKRFVLTLTGSDKIGIVEQVTELILDCGGDVQASRMARLGGEFSMMFLVSIPEDEADNLSGKIENLSSAGFNAR